MRTGESIYYCKRILSDNSIVDTFNKPEKITLRLHHFSLQPTSGYLDMMKYGENISSYQRIIAQPYGLWKGYFKRGDRLYVDVKPTEEDMESETADHADYEVDNVMEQQMVIRVIIKKLTMRE